ncbi:hypothetical protein HYQ46_001863 [Verticillium longisporum]|nr:hypothetical protein HYQ46_001863 [Verticillium longisporum]
MAEQEQRFLRDLRVLFANQKYKAPTQEGNPRKQVAEVAQPRAVRCQEQVVVIDQYRVDQCRIGQRPRQAVELGHFQVDLQAQGAVVALAAQTHHQHQKQRKAMQ